MTVTKANRAAVGAARGGVPSGTSVKESKTRGITVAAINITTVPETVGVNKRRISESRAASANWKIDDTTMRVAMVDGPPTTSAVTQTAMKTPDVPIIRMCPDPNRPTRTACKTVVRPLITSTAKTPQEM